MEELKIILDEMIEKIKEAASKKDVESVVRIEMSCASNIMKYAEKYPDKRIDILEFVYAHKPLSQFGDIYVHLARSMNDQDYIKLLPILHKKKIKTHTLEFWAIHYSIKNNWLHVLQKLQKDLYFFINDYFLSLALQQKEINYDLVNYLDQQIRDKSRTESPILLACKDLDMETIKVFKNFGYLNVNTKDNYGSCALHYINTIENSIEEVEIVEFLIEEGIDINAKNNAGITPLMQYAMAGKTKLVEILLEHGADTSVRAELTAFDVASNDKIKEMIENVSNNHPQKLVKILTNFTSPDFKPIRFTTHSWDFDLKKEYGNFENFMKEVKKQWDEFKDELENLSPNLHQKIESFLFETDRAKRIGWSSLKDLQQWCDDGKDPFDLIVGDKKFEEYIKEFKKEIEIRKEQNHLEALFIAQRKKLGRKFNVELEKLKGKTFYTDVEKFTLALDKIFKVIKDNAHEEKNTIEVKAQDAENGEYVDIMILHKNSFSSTDAKTLAREAKDGDFSDIRRNLTNLCDWSVQNYHEGKADQINYLRSDNSKEIVELEEKTEGFTHILRFYK